MNQSTILAAENENKQSFKEQIFSLIGSQAEGNQDLVIPKTLLKFVDGDLPTAALLAKLIDWSDEATKESEWICRNEHQLYEEAGLGDYEIYEAVQYLEKVGLITSEGYHETFRWAFKLHREALINALQEFLKGDHVKVSYYKLYEDTIPDHLESQLTLKDFIIERCKFLDFRLQIDIESRLEMHPDFEDMDSITFPVSRWIKICDALSAIYNDCKGADPECISDEYCKDPYKYEYCKNCFKPYM